VKPCDFCLVFDALHFNPLEPAWFPRLGGAGRAREASMTSRRQHADVFVLDWPRMISTAIWEGENHSAIMLRNLPGHMIRLGGKDRLFDHCKAELASTLQRLWSLSELGRSTPGLNCRLGQHLQAVTRIAASAAPTTLRTFPHTFETCSAGIVLEPEANTF